MKKIIITEKQYKILNELGNRGLGLIDVISRNYYRMGNSFTKRNPDPGFEFAEKWESKGDIAKHLRKIYGISYEMAQSIVDHLIDNTTLIKEHAVIDSLKQFFNDLINVAKREGNESVEAVKILKKIINRDHVSKAEKEFLRSQSLDLARIIAVVGTGAVSVAIPIALDTILKKISKNKWTMIPQDQSKNKEEIFEFKKKA